MCDSDTTSVLATNVRTRIFFSNGFNVCYSLMQEINLERVLGSDGSGQSSMVSYSESANETSDSTEIGVFLRLSRECKPLKNDSAS
jgi:hypothetical protein